ncbi:unnamed protein product [Spirodela intermedia]|uniref:Uncharacterized protein n=1 Tax=Spirodela intermedia TaxID=51605 RepID=A0ABN7EAG7_SPIIN|nr:unnamed protein product [Spirodela intermedia]
MPPPCAPWRAGSYGPHDLAPPPALGSIHSDGERDPSPSALETPAFRVQPDRRAKMKEPSFRYTA